MVVGVGVESDEKGEVHTGSDWTDRCRAVCPSVCHVRTYARTPHALVHKDALDVRHGPRPPPPPPLAPTVPQHNHLLAPLLLRLIIVMLLLLLLLLRCFC